MVNTVQIKKAQLTDGFFTTGSGAEVVLVMGSCRVCNIVTYLDEWNKSNGNRFTIHSLDPFNNCWDVNDNRVDYEQAINNLETDERLLKMLKSVDIFLHEHYQNFGMFNTFKGKEKTIYDFGMAAPIDVCFPSFNDLFILAGDILTFDVDIKKKALQDFNISGKLSQATKDEIFEKSQTNLDKFYEVCRKSDVPEMGTFFGKNFIEKRLWWTYNHTTKAFTLALFDLVNDRFLKLDMTKGFDREHEDIFRHNFTRLTDLDIELFNYKWGEEVLPVASKLFF